MVQDLGFRQHPVGVEHQVSQQLELGRGDLDDALVAPDLTRVLVKLEVVEAQGRTVVEHAVGPSQHGPDPGDDFLEAEWLGDVVVATDGQPLDLVLE